jgi:cytidylate kinase
LTSDDFLTSPQKEKPNLSSGSAGISFFRRKGLKSYFSLLYARIEVRLVQLDGRDGVIRLVDLLCRTHKRGKSDHQYYNKQDMQDLAFHVLIL